MKGKFITIYGINNIGKSTQAKKLVENLVNMGLEAVFLKYPIYDLEPTGPEINNILRSNGAQNISEEDLQTLFARNRKDFEPQLKQMLEQGKIVIAEDYTGTGIAWGRAKGLDQNWLENLNKDLLKEDFSILLVGKRVIKAREENHIHETNDELVKEVGEILLQLAAKNGWEIVEVQANKEETAKIISEKVKVFLSRC